MHSGGRHYIYAFKVHPLLTYQCREMSWTRFETLLAAVRIIICLVNHVGQQKNMLLQLWLSTATFVQQLISRFTFLVCLLLTCWDRVTVLQRFAVAGSLGTGARSRNDAKKGTPHEQESPLRQRSPGWEQLVQISCAYKFFCFFAACFYRRQWEHRWSVLMACWPWVAATLRCPSSFGAQ